MKPKTVTVTEELKEGITELLSLAQRVIDLQYDDDVADELESTLLYVAEAFGITTTEMTVDVSEDGKTYTVTHSTSDQAEPDFPGWTPKLILGDKDKDPEIH